MFWHYASEPAPDGAVFGVVGHFWWVYETLPRLFGPELLEAPNAGSFKFAQMIRLVKMYRQSDVSAPSAPVAYSHIPRHLFQLMLHREEITSLEPPRKQHKPPPPAHAKHKCKNHCGAGDAISRHSTPIQKETPGLHRQAMQSTAQITHVPAPTHPLTL